MTTPDPTTAPPAPAPAAAPYAGQAVPPAGQSVPPTPQWGTGTQVPAAKNVPLALAAGFGAMLATALLYGFIVKAIDFEISWMVIGIAAAVAYPLGKLGGDNPALRPVGALFTVLGFFLGEMFGLALIVHEQTGVSVVSALTEHSDVLFDVWKTAFDVKSALFIAIGVFVGFSMTKTFGRS
ncbi:hypothetical protein [Streptomyces sp. TLI_171]|uniref:hypothetical protein n=1 Tax=Streptomyces sp. TLI_171 TaxID=1938859 RepID=UPI000C1A88BB|nr:hypothetical protein [Streptomyces sp. TLI_171]RKE19504.1 hypothetical protein BX266_2827 [Streptomyces sp. TLI_171]